jgi:putative RNA 2'-phosphotransferase
MTDQNFHKRTSKFLSLVLRHQPETLGISLDKNGWTNVAELLSKMNSKGRQVDLEALEVIVETNDKKRFAFNDDKSMIRANQGHSTPIDLGYEVKTPPAILYHGTGEKSVESIWNSGLKKQKRHHVHLSKDLETAISVGGRHGKPFIFEVLTSEMVNDGFEFFESTNGVWLTNEVPTKYLKKRN